MDKESFQLSGPQYMMKKQTSRKDFISDSSSDDDDLPDLGSLRERLARKRQFSAFSSCTSGTSQLASQTLEETSNDIDAGRKVETNCRTFSDIDSLSYTDTASTAAENCTENYDSSGSESEKLSLSQVIQNSAETNEIEEITRVEKTTEIEKIREAVKKTEVGKNEEVKVKKKRTAEEIEDSRRKAQVSL